MNVLIPYLLTLILPIATIVSHANSLNLDETPSNSVNSQGHCHNFPKTIMLNAKLCKLCVDRVERRPVSNNILGVFYSVHLHLLTIPGGHRIPTDVTGQLPATTRLQQAKITLE